MTKKICTREHDRKKEEKEETRNQNKNVQIRKLGTSLLLMYKKS